MQLASGDLSGHFKILELFAYGVWSNYKSESNVENVGLAGMCVVPHCCTHGVPNLAVV